MKVVNDWPPNIQAIRAVFPLGKGVIFTWGDTIFNPDGYFISKELKAHEAVHCTQQGDDIEGWWERYLVDPEFRFSQELEAHQVEWRTYKKLHRNRNKRAFFLNRIASRLASPLYGSLVTPSEARRMILK